MSGTSPLAVDDRGRGRHWPFIIIGFLLCDVVLYLGGAWVASRDPSFVVEDRYYERAKKWDEHIARVRADEALGWRLTPNVTLAADANGEADLLAVLTDRGGAPISGAAVEVSAFPIARSGETLSARAGEIGPGLYRAALPMRRMGLWEFRFDVQKGAIRFTPVIRKDIALPDWRR